MDRRNEIDIVMAACNDGIRFESKMMPHGLSWGKAVVWEGGAIVSKLNRSFVARLWNLKKSSCACSGGL